MAQPFLSKEGNKDKKLIFAIRNKMIKMARQIGILKFSGTLYGLTFYKLDGLYYVRRKTSLDRKRVMHDPCFAASRQCMSRFGLASRIAKQVYHKLPERKKRPGLFGRMTGKASRMLFTGEPPEVVLQKCLDAYLPSAARLIRQWRESKKTVPVSGYGIQGAYAAAARLLHAVPVAASEDFPGFVWARIP